MKEQRRPLVRYTMKMSKAQIVDFLGELHEIQLQYIDEALEKSDLKEAKEILERIMAK